MSFAPVSTLMPGMIPASVTALAKGVPSFFCWRIVSTNTLAETGGRHNQLPIGAPGLLSLRNPQLGKSLVAGWITLIHRQQALVAGHCRPRGVYKLLRIHLGLPHFQFRISGMSW